MKTLAVYTLFYFLTISLFVSCSSDDPVSSNPNPPSGHVVDSITLLSKDSIYTNQSNPGQFASISYLTTVQVDTIKLDFSLSLYGIRTLSSYKVDTDTLFKFQSRPLSLPLTQYDTTFSLTIPLNKINFQSLISIYPTSGFFTGQEFASLKNIKLWYIRRS